ncbi:M48 family metallopeptidase [Aestuariibius insulae]|uniref:M48 family metallopeptidase n=1 Tax=Aestuariibius insulae TaxID=2058287 RepID=UPI00345EC985
MTVIRVGTEVPRFEGVGLFYDGDTPIPRPARIDIDDGTDTLRIHILPAGEGPTPAPVLWPLSSLRALPDRPVSELIVWSNDDPLPRLRLTGEAERRILAARALDLHNRPRMRGRGKLLGLAIGAVGSVALMMMVLVPFLADSLADYLPPSGEEALGSATFDQIRSALDDSGYGFLPICENPTGLASLDMIEDRIVKATGFEGDLAVHVLDHPMVNAFALPGGYIIFFRGLLEEAETAEEVAAVFAHELGHVDARDPTRIALRSAGSIGLLGLLFGDFAGGTMVLWLAREMIQADYTRDVEAAADAYAHIALLAADLPPSAIATFFERLVEETEMKGTILAHLTSHPEMGDRIEAARAATPEGRSFTPLMSDEEFEALQTICDYDSDYDPDPAEEEYEDLLPPGYGDTADP